MIEEVTLYSGTRPRYHIIQMGAWDRENGHELFSPDLQERMANASTKDVAEVEEECMAILNDAAPEGFYYGTKPKTNDYGFFRIN